jgi:molybdenum cofactor synthesis domain-containing protein
MNRTAAALIIGNEVLTGKVQELNVRVLAKALFKLGIEFRACRICPDIEEDIIRDVVALKESYDFVFTSGGVGPTHDDITLSAVAAAFGREVVRNEDIAARLHEYHGDALTDAHLRMADLPADAELLRGGKLSWPAIKVDNVFVLPGVPKAFQWKLETIAMHLRDASAPTFESLRVYTRSDEALLAPLLDELDAKYGDVDIGSYVRWDHPHYKVLITFDGADKETLELAASEFREKLPEGQLVLTELAESIEE